MRQHFFLFWKLAMLCIVIRIYRETSSLQTTQMLLDLELSPFVTLRFVASRSLRRVNSSVTEISTLFQPIFRLWVLAVDCLKNYKPARYETISILFPFKNMWKSSKAVASLDLLPFLDRKFSKECFRILQSVLHESENWRFLLSSSKPGVFSTALVVSGGENTIFKFSEESDPGLSETEHPRQTVSQHLRKLIEKYPEQNHRQSTQIRKSIL